MIYKYTSHIPDKYFQRISAITHSWHKGALAVIKLWYKLITDLKNEFSLMKSVSVLLTVRLTTVTCSYGP